MAIHHPGSRAGTGVALKAIREAVMHGSGKGIFATLNVVPLPPKGSSTIFVGLEQQRIIRPSNCSGIWQP